ncbi:hypothetical protein ROHU_010731 [Labeo rohita]|uniref:Uncharacterized protein n=1 Tax=Labeo rohita TaxID=84645 RepID=A0A498LTC3_LABRO|nr:hypothetical protein ROHU_010731 [Labeo rohita]
MQNDQGLLTVHMAATQLDPLPRRGLAHPPMQRSTSGSRGELQRIRVVPHGRVQPIPWAAPVAAECRWKEEPSEVGSSEGNSSLSPDGDIPIKV